MNQPYFVLADAAGEHSLVFEATPRVIPDDATADEAAKDISPRVCAVRVRDVGEALPCLYHLGSSSSRTTYKKTRSSKPFLDTAFLDMGRICPVMYPDEAEAERNLRTLKVSMYYVLPPQGSISTMDDYMLSAGITLTNKTMNRKIWHSVSNYKVKKEDFENIEKANKPSGKNIGNHLNCYEAAKQRKSFLH